MPLTNKYLKETSRLADSIFPTIDVLPSKFFEASLDQYKFKKFMNSHHIKVVEYFIAIDNGTVVGTTGIYTMDKDNEDSCRLGRYCVDEKYRGQGVGRLLIEFSIDKAKQYGKKFLNLYTSTSEVEKNAQILYEKNGFFITKQQKVENEDYEIIFRRKQLY